MRIRIPAFLFMCLIAVGGLVTTAIAPVAGKPGEDKPARQLVGPKKDSPDKSNNGKRGRTTTTTEAPTITTTTVAAPTTTEPPATTTAAPVTTTTITAPSTTTAAAPTTTSAAPTTTTTSTTAAPTTTTVAPTTTSTTAAPTTTTSTTVPAGSDYLETPEGTIIEIDSAGDWTAEEVHSMLLANGLDDEIGANLTVRVQDVYPSSAAVGASTTGETYTGFSAVLYLKGVNSSFVATPDAVLSHELGHIWTMYHYYLAQQADWSGYLDARGLTGDSRLDNAYHWSIIEIIADDYRLLFGSADAVAQRPTHLNPDIADPRDVPGLAEYLAESFTG